MCEFDIAFYWPGMRDTVVLGIFSGSMWTGIILTKFAICMQDFKNNKKQTSDPFHF